VSLFITFEGPEGSGKTTQVSRLYARLQAQGFQVLLTREPGGTSIGDQIRQVLLSPANVELVATAEILLYSASRAQLVEQVIRPALARGSVVISDRYADSTLAYQGYGRSLDLDAVRAITAFATGGLVPDLTIYLDLDVRVGLRRKLAAASQTGDEWNRLEVQDLAFHERVRAGYLALAAAEPQRWMLVDATRPVEEIEAAIWSRAEQLLRKPTMGGKMR
jgi:dTMP kinase